MKLKDLEQEFPRGIPLRPVLTSQEFFDFIRIEKPTLYHRFDIDLSVARNQQEFKIQGTFFQILKITQGAQIFVKFNEIWNQKMLFDSTQLISIPFYRFFLTNSATPGATVSIFVGDNITYFPFIRLEYTDLSELNQKTLSPLTSNIQISRLTLTTEPREIKPNEETRRGILIQNMSDVNIVYIGKDNTVSITNGFPIFPYGALRLDSEKKLYTGAVWGVANENTEISVLSFYE